MEMLQGFWKQHLRPRAVVGYDVKIFLPSPLNYVTRSPGCFVQYSERHCLSSADCYKLWLSDNYLVPFTCTFSLLIVVDHTKILNGVFSLKILHITSHTSVQTLISFIFTDAFQSRDQ